MPEPLFFIPATLRDEQVGIINIADYILYLLNKNSIFDYVEEMCLEEPCDDVMEMLINSAKAQNKFIVISKKIMGKFCLTFYKCKGLFSGSEILLAFIFIKMDIKGKKVSHYLKNQQSFENCYTLLNSEDYIAIDTDSFWKKMRHLKKLFLVSGKN